MRKDQKKLSQIQKLKMRSMELSAQAGRFITEPKFKVK